MQTTNPTYTTISGDELSNGDEILYGDHTAEVDELTREGDTIRFTAKTPFGAEPATVGCRETVKRRVYL